MGLWGALMNPEANILAKVDNKVSDNIYAVYFDYDGDWAQPYAFFLGFRVPDDSGVPDGLDTIVIPAQQYTVVQAPNVDGIGPAWQGIWENAELNAKREYRFDFEVSSLSAPTVDIYIGVKH